MKTGHVAQDFKTWLRDAGIKKSQSAGKN